MKADKIDQGIIKKKVCRKKSLTSSGKAVIVTNSYQIFSIFEDLPPAKREIPEPCCPQGVECVSDCTDCTNCTNCTNCTDCTNCTAGGTGGSELPAHVHKNANGDYEPDIGYQWVNDDPDNFDVIQIPPGTPYDGLPNVVWSEEPGKICPALGYQWVEQNNPGLGVEPMPNIVFLEEGTISPALGYEWVDENNPKDARVQLITGGFYAPVAHWVGNWNEKEKQLIRYALRELKDEELRNWIATNVYFQRLNLVFVSPISANDVGLRVKNDFFSITPGKQMNLFAFEAGKAFWNIMEGEQTLLNWWDSFPGKYNSVIDYSKIANYRDENLSIAASGVVEADHIAQFAYVFRAVVLPLDKPEGQGEQQEWDNAIQEFREHINGVLPHKKNRTRGK